MRWFKLYLIVLFALYAGPALATDAHVNGECMKVAQVLEMTRAGSGHVESVSEPVHGVSEVLVANQQTGRWIVVTGFRGVFCITRYGDGYAEVRP